MPDLARSIAVAPSRGIGRSLLLTLPMALFTLLLFTPVLRQPGRPARLAAMIAWAFMLVLFFLMMRTRETYRWRRVFFITLGFLFPVGFIWDLITSALDHEHPHREDDLRRHAVLLHGDSHDAHSRRADQDHHLPRLDSAHGVKPPQHCHDGGALAAGHGGSRQGLVQLRMLLRRAGRGILHDRKKARLRKINPKLRLVPWAILVAIVLLSAATYEPIYCMWLCPFKAVTEFPAVRSVQTAVQFGIFIALFLGLVVVLPYLTKRRTQCAFFCPFGAFQSIFSRTSIFDIRINKEKCAAGCVLCQNHCPTLSIDKQSIEAGKTLSTCMRCGACVDVCRKDAAVWHIKGTSVGVSPERARLLYLYAAWVFASMFGGSIIANSLQKLLGLII